MNDSVNLLMCDNQERGEGEGERGGRREMGDGEGECLYVREGRGLGLY